MWHHALARTPWDDGENCPFFLFIHLNFYSNIWVYLRVWCFYLFISYFGSCNLGDMRRASLAHELSSRALFWAKRGSFIHLLWCAMRFKSVRSGSDPGPLHHDPGFVGKMRRKRAAGFEASSSVGCWNGSTGTEIRQRVREEGGSELWSTGKWRRAIMYQESQILMRCSNNLVSIVTD